MDYSLKYSATTSNLALTFTLISQETLRRIVLLEFTPTFVGSPSSHLAFLFGTLFLLKFAMHAISTYLKNGIALFCLIIRTHHHFIDSHSNSRVDRSECITAFLVKSVVKNVVKLYTRQCNAPSQFWIMDYFC